MKSKMENAMKIVKRTRFTLIELLVCIAIIGILASLLLPVLSRAKYSAKLVVCMNNLKQVGTGFYMYADANNRKFYARRTGNQSNWNDGGYACALYRRVSNDNFNDLPYYRDYLPAPIMSCPVMPPYQSDIYTSTSGQIWAGYSLFAGWKPHYNAPEDTRLSKLGDTMSYTYNGNTDEFDILASDIDYSYGWSGTDYARTSQPDYSPSYLELWEYNTSSFLATNYNLYTNAGTALRGKIDCNYVRGDGSVFMLKGLVLKDSRLSLIPPKPNVHIDSQRYNGLPPVE